MNWLSKLKLGLTKTSEKISSGIDDIFNKRKLDDQTAEELEDLLISSDLGTETASFLIKELRDKNRFYKELDPAEIKTTLANLIAQILTPLVVDKIDLISTPHVMIMCGVNGNGKTTSIAKLANFFKNQDKKIILGACDTFRAAAVEQLSVWANRLNIEIVTGPTNSDPASVAHKAVKQAIESGFDLLLLDTAGRLQNKDNLMAELSKIFKVVQKIDDNLKPQTILVIDATTGQNAFSQVEKFNAVEKIDGLIITKLDGTAKGGIIVALARKYNIPILAIGVGEGIDDLRPFSAEEFAKNLLN